MSQTRYKFLHQHTNVLKNDDIENDDIAEKQTIRSSVILLNQINI